MGGFIRNFVGRRPIPFSRANAPVITTSYLTINENSTEVGLLQSTDPNGLTVTFSVYSGLDASKFEITDNILSFKVAPDFDNPGSANGNNTYWLTVKAINTANRVATKPIKVDVINVNEIPGTISLDVAEISEGEPVSTLIGTLSTTLEGTITYSIISGHDATSFSLDGANLVSNSIFNYETKDVYNVTIKASNGIDDDVTKTFTINVLNVGENPTLFTLSKNYINEENSIGDTVAILSCVDPENNSTKEYSFVDGAGDTDNASFTITDNLLKAAEVFDYETKNNYSIRLKVVTDTGELEDSFIINILNVNEAPVFTSSTTFSMPETSTTAGTVVATDPEDQAIAYSIVGGDDMNLLSINSSTGVLSFRTNPNFNIPTDKDGNNIYNVIVRASDTDFLYTNQIINITVTDVAEGEIYISPTGNDNNVGTITAPLFTLNKAWSKVTKPGDKIIVRGGTYNYTTVQRIQGKSGTTAAYITIENYPGETPIFDFHLVPNTNYIQALATGFANGQQSNYIKLKGIRVTNIPQVVNTNVGILLAGGTNYCIIENCTTDHIGGYGLTISNDASYNLILNCDSYLNADPLSGYGGSNGFGMTTVNTSVGNIFRGCRAWLNSDDGFDFYATNVHVELDNCWAFWNGYDAEFVHRGNGSGFKFGPNTSGAVLTNLRTVKNCLAFENYLNGFDVNQAEGANYFPVTLYNCTSYKNGVVAGGGGYWFSKNHVAHTFTNNIAYANGFNTGITAESIQTTNSWNGFTVTDADFLSVSSVGADGARQADGSLPDLDFLKLATDSSMVNAGTIVSGIPYTGARPDLGCFESDVVNDLNNYLVASWRLDEVSGEYIDAKGNNDSISHTNTMNADYAEFDGTGKLINFGNTTDLQLSAPFSISFNAYATAFDTYNTILSKENLNSDLNGYSFYTYTGRVTFEIANATTFSNTPFDDTLLSTGAWYHIVGTYSGSVMKIYINGVNVGERNTTLVPITNVYNLQIGKDPVASDDWNGRVKKVAIWDRVLTDQDVTDLYNGGDVLTYPFS